MRLNMELEFDKYCVVDGSPTTVLPLPRQHSKNEKRRSKGYSRHSNDVFNLKEEAIARSFNRYRSASCKTSSCLRKVSTVSDELRKRGSVYQSSKEVRLMQKTDVIQERKKIEFSCGGGDTSFSFGIVESLCSSDEDNIHEEERRDSVMSLRSEMNSSGLSDVSTCHVLTRNRTLFDKVKEIRDDSDIGGNICATKAEIEHVKDMKGRYGQFRRVLDPFLKSKFQKTTTSSSSSEQNEFSNIGHPWQSEERFRNSPAHLQGLIKVVMKHGIPLFEFSVKAPEEHYIAKIWKSDKSLDWIYTFHSSHDARKSNASGKGSKESSKLSSMVGQMHVSCYLRTKPDKNGVSNNTMTSEFVLYNVSNSRRSVSVSRVYADDDGVAKAPKVHDENSVQVSHNADEIWFQGNAKGHNHQSTRRDDSPLAATELLAHLQAAAIVVQVPFDGNMIDASDIQHSQQHFVDFTSPTKVNVIIPCGLHSVPTTTEEIQGPLPLLDRWRIGGGCDCGGWDLACPLNVLRNSTVQIREDDLMENNQPLDLFIQGKKDNTPALSIRETDQDCQYAVDFHAQLSTLQAFSVSIAVLHATEPSLGFAREQRNRLLQHDSLDTKVEVETLIDAAVVDTNKTKVNKNIRKSIPMSFTVKPPFSPIARV